MDQEKKDNRRQFLVKGLMGGGLFASAALFLHHSFSFVFPEKAKIKKRKLLVGRIDELKVGEAKDIKIGDRDLFLVRTEEGFKVFSAICTHLGCKIKWQGYRNRFYCACHQGIFSQNGEVISGPPPVPLEEFEVEVDKNLVYMWLEESSGGLV